MTHEEILSDFPDLAEKRILPGNWITCQPAWFYKECLR